MRIPTGGFGNQDQRVIGSVPVNTEGSQAIARATQNLAGASLKLADDQMNMARAKAVNALADHDLAVEQAAFDIKKRVQTGELPYAEAQKAYDDTISELKPPQIDGADLNTMEGLGQGIAKTNARGSMHMQGFVLEREQDDYKGQFTQFLDTQKKLAGMPGANVEAINESGAMAAQAMARKAGIPEATSSKYIQDFKDSNWYNNAREKAIASRESIDGLRALESDLASADGYYQGKLDTEKRDALLSQVMNQRTQLENKIQIQADRREVRAERAVLQMDQQMSTGFPSTADQQLKWQAATKGTIFEGEYKQRLVNEQLVQQVLRLPINEQIQHAQAEQARLQRDGGTPQQIANVRRLADTVSANVKQLQESPLLFAQARTGESVEPLELGLLLEPGGAEQLQASLQERVTTLGALRQQYGDQVQQRPLLPQEATALASALAQATPQQQGALFQALHAGLGDSEAYRGAMQQIAPDSPVKAAAGVLMGYSGAQTTDTHWLGPDDHVTAKAGATTLLIGESLINRTSADSKTDGKPLSLPIPSATKFSAEFQKAVGDAFAGRPQAYMAAEQAARAHYVGASAEAGSFSEEVVEQQLHNSIKIALGEPVNYKSSKIILPWGMDESTFRDKAGAALGEALRDRMTPEQVSAEIVKFPRMDVINFGDGEYLVMDGARRPYLPDGKPLVIKVGQ